MAQAAAAKAPDLLAVVQVQALERFLHRLVADEAGPSRG
jgi:hypothetical protein